MSHVSKMTLFIYISLLVSISLACGVSSELPNFSPTATDLPASATAESSPAPESYIVSGSWNIRECAGEGCEVIGVVTGGVVICYQYQTVDGGRWCRHDAGWSNMRGMK